MKRLFYYFYFATVKGNLLFFHNLLSLFLLLSKGKIMRQKKDQNIPPKPDEVPIPPQEPPTKPQKEPDPRTWPRREPEIEPEGPPRREEPRPQEVPPPPRKN